MKRAIVFTAAALLLSATSVFAFMSSGHVNNISFMEFTDFERNGDGYTFTLRNGVTNDRSEFYLIVRGLDFLGRTVYRKRVYIDFLEGNGEKKFTLPVYNSRISSWYLEYKKVPERDVRIVDDYTD